MTGCERCRHPPISIESGESIERGIENVSNLYNTNERSWVRERACIVSKHAEHLFRRLVGWRGSVEIPKDVGDFNAKQFEIARGFVLQ